MTKPTTRQLHVDYIASLTDRDLAGYPEQAPQPAGPGFPPFTHIPHPEGLLEILWQSEDDAPPIIREGNEPDPWISWGWTWDCMP